MWAILRHKRGTLGIRVMGKIAGSRKQEGSAGGVKGLLLKSAS